MQFWCMNFSFHFAEVLSFDVWTTYIFCAKMCFFFTEWWVWESFDLRMRSKPLRIIYFSISKKNWLFLARYYSEIRARQRNFGNLKIHHHPNDFFAPLLVLNRPTTQVAKYIYHTPFQYFFSIFVLTTLYHLPTFPIFFFLIMHNFYFWPHGSLIWHEILCSPWFGVKMVQRWKSLQGLQSIGSMMRVFISPTSIGAEREENVCT